ncbi:MAG: hypothetical protein INR71_10655 [Terriglobus roseus]|nr:hypothetical protein [Terriglobus roseus]
MFTTIQNATTQTLSTVLLSSGFTFRKMALAVVPAVVASPFVWLFGGFIADLIANFHARRNGGRREPEAHLWSLIVPLICMIIGTILYGYSGQHVNDTPTIALLIGVFFISLGFLAGNSVLSVFVVESYPQWAG